MLSKYIIIAISVAACFRNSSQVVLCKNDVMFKHAIMNAPNSIVLIIVTNDAKSKINESIRKNFRGPLMKIQVNLKEGDCSRIVQLLEISGNHTTEVRMMKGTYLVDAVRLVDFDVNRLNESYKYVNELRLQPLSSTKKSLTLKQLVSDWPDDTTPGTGPQEGPQGSSQPMPDTGPQNSPQGSSRPMPDKGPQAATRTFLFALPDGYGAIPAIGSSVTPSQRANLTTYQQTGATDLTSDSFGPVHKNWLSLAVPQSEPADDGSDDDPPASGQGSTTTPAALKPKPKIQKPSAAGSSRGPR